MNSKVIRSSGLIATGVLIGVFATHLYRQCPKVSTKGAYSDTLTAAQATVSNSGERPQAESSGTALAGGVDPSRAAPEPQQSAIAEPAVLDKVAVATNEAVLNGPGVSSSASGFNQARLDAAFYLSNYYEKKEAWSDVERVASICVTEGQKASPVDQHVLAIAWWKFSYALYRQDKFSQAIAPAQEACRCFQHLDPTYAKERSDCTTMLAALQSKTQSPQSASANNAPVTFVSGGALPSSSMAKAQTNQPSAYYQPVSAVTAGMHFGGGGGMYYSTGSSHWISENHDGEIIELEDGSVWKVASMDAIDSRLWLRLSDITVVESEYGSDYQLINTDDNEKVTATLIKR